MTNTDGNVFIKHGERVGLMRRLAAIFYDMILLMAVLVLASLIVIVPLRLTIDHPLYPLYVVYIYVIAYIYFAWFWIHGGQTLGMRTWGIVIVAANGKMTWKIALKRYLLALLSWLMAGLGFLWCLFDRDGMTLHDRLSGSLLTRTASPRKNAD